MGLGEYPLGFWGRGHGNLGFRGGAWGLRFWCTGGWDEGVKLGAGLQDLEYLGTTI